MDMQDRQYIGILASDEESDGRDNVLLIKDRIFNTELNLYYYLKKALILYRVLLIHLKMILK